MTGEEVHQVEGLVNSWIQQDHSLTTHVVPLQEAKDKGQIHVLCVCRPIISDMLQSLLSTLPATRCTWCTEQNVQS